MSYKLLEHRLRSRQCSKRIRRPWTHSKVREGVCESIEQNLTGGYRRINEPLKLKRMSRNLLASRVREDWDVCNSYRIDARVDDLNLQLPTIRRRRACERCNRSILKRSQPQPKHYAAVRPRFQDSITFGLCHQASRPIDEWPLRKTQCYEATSITIRSLLKAPAPQPTALGNVPVSCIGNRAECTRHTDAVKLFKHSRE